MPQNEPEKISQEYYRFVDSFAKSEFQNDKLLGRFYTDYNVADNMTAVMIQELDLKDKRELSIIDPFCGDGRLVISLLRKIIESGMGTEIDFSIYAWDIDENAVDTAREALAKFCRESNLSFQIYAENKDAFIEYREKTFDICVTNPPWGLMKPQKIFGRNNTEEDLQLYRETLEKYDDYMKKEFIISQPTSKFGKWGTNLGRCGTEVAVRLIGENGLCGIVSPASLMNDQVSNVFRDWLFSEHRIIDVSYYPAELKLYGSADVSSITMVLGKGKTDPNMKLRIFSDTKYCKHDKIPQKSFEYLERTHYKLPLKTGVKSLKLMARLKEMMTVQEYCDEHGLQFTREIDETRIKEKLLPEGKIVFAKGYMVDRYSFSADDLYLNEEVVVPPVSVHKYKLVWRDVSRDSQVRRIKASLLPPEFICGNSLGVIYGGKDKIGSLKYLLGTMNSMVFEYQARNMLVSNHVSAGIIKQINIPKPKSDDAIVDLVDRRLLGENVDDEIECCVAERYGISEEEFSLIVDTFNIPVDMRNSLKEKYLMKARG